MPTILVLEDDPSRMKWLRDQFGSFCEILHADTVGGFLAIKDKPHDLVIFDHDLDLTHTGGFNDPRPDGYIAAQSYERSGPALVWSWNPSGTERIALSLRSRAVPTVTSRFCPNVDYAALISGMLGGWRR